MLLASGEMEVNREQSREKSVFLIKHSPYSWLYLGLILLEVRILPAARELREACVYLPSHLHFLVWIQSKRLKKRRWVLASWDKPVILALFAQPANPSTWGHQDCWKMLGNAYALLGLFNCHKTVIILKEKRSKHIGHLNGVLLNISSQRNWNAFGI